MTIHLASGNAHKAREMQRLADADPVSRALAVSVFTAANMPAVVEDTGTFIGNALKKAYALQALLPAGSWVLADDSGVCVDALSGEPGVESAYYAGLPGDPVANLRKLAEVMRDVPEGGRSARFLCVLALLGPAGIEQTFEGRCEGALCREPRGGGGFGYDPLFIPEGFTRTYAELSEMEKDSISHRGRAWAKMAAWLARQGNLSD